MFKTASSFFACLIIALLAHANPLSADEKKPVAQPAPKTHEELLQSSRAIVQSFAKDLKKDLSEALESGSPAQAVGICKTIAPILTRTTSAHNKLNIRRTAFKLRNPRNAPDEFERRTMEMFVEKIKAGEPAAKLEHSEFVSIGKRKLFRYMKAIPTAEKPCLVCHGSNLGEELQDTINFLYPEDKAIGFKAGELRGAFSVIQRAE